MRGALIIADDHVDAATLTAQMSSMTFLDPDGHPRALLVLLRTTRLETTSTSGRSMSAHSSPIVQRRRPGRITRSG